MIESIAVLLWSLFVILVPGCIYSKLINSCSKNLLKRLISSISIGVYIIVILGYLLDWSDIGFCAENLIFSFVIIISIGFLLSHFYKVKIFSDDLSVLTLRCFWLTLLFMLPSLFLLIAPAVFDPKIYPTDPIITHLRIRHLIYFKSFVNELNQISLGYAMSYPLGLDYLIATCAAPFPKMSFFIIRIIGPIFSVLSLVAVYTFGRDLSNEKIGGVIGFLTVGSAYLWIWFRKMTLANGIAEFIVICSLISFYEFLITNKREFFKEFLVTGACSWLIHPPTMIMYLVPTYLLFMLKQKVNTMQKFYTSFKYFAYFIVLTLPFWYFVSLNTILWKCSIQASELGVNFFIGIDLNKLDFNYCVRPILESWTGYNVPYIFGIVPLALGIISVLISLGCNNLMRFSLAFIAIGQFLYYLNFIEPLSTFFALFYTPNRMLLHSQLTLSLLLAATVPLKQGKVFITVVKKRFSIHLRKLFILILAVCLSIQLGNTYISFYHDGSIISTYGGYDISNDYVILLDYLDQMLPKNATIFIDNGNIPSLNEFMNNISESKPWIKSFSALQWEAVYRQFIFAEYSQPIPSYQARSLTWLAISRLYPRKVQGVEKKITDILTSNDATEQFVKFLYTNQPDVVIISKPDLIQVAETVLKKVNVPYFYYNRYLIVTVI